ncbi:MAG: hypothetical protein KDG50_08885 [Chromatiales bacterium]|nr:hypothetical protein [Chromatiales bacterium]
MTPANGSTASPSPRDRASPASGSVATRSRGDGTELLDMVVWIVVLMIQSLPYATSVFMAGVSALPASKPAGAVPPAVGTAASTAR